MGSSEVWGDAVAATYDSDDSSMFAPDVLGPTVDLLAELAAGGAALEFAIGTGRVGLALSERGVEVHGIELSPAMVAVLAAKPGADRVPVTIGDMATTRLGHRFRLVYLVYNTITNLLTQDEQVECFRNAAVHLEPGGHFLIETFVPDLQRLPHSEVFVPFDVSPTHIGIDEYDVANQMLVSHHHLPAHGGVMRSTHRYAWPAEYDLMARLAGMQLVHRWGDWRREPFTADSRTHVSVWRAPA